MSHSTGTIVHLDDEIRSMLGNVSSTATINLEVDKLGFLEEVVECGNLDVVDCLYEPPVMDYGDMFFDCMENFMSGNAAECNRIANEIYSYELKTKGGAGPSIIRESERNIEYVMFNEPDSVLAQGIKEYSNCFSLLFPSKGTISRVGRSAIRNRCQYVYLNSKMEDKYLDNYKRVCDEMGFKYIVVGPDYVFDPDLLYYASFNYSNVIACGIYHYICSEPNFYQAVFNEVCTALCYNDYGYNMTYNRDGMNRSITQLYYDPNRCIIGADSMYQLYRGSKRIIGGIMHDVYSDKVYTKYKIKVPYGSTPISNTYCLVGDYYHKGDVIYARGGEVVHRNDGRNASVKALSNHWKIADPEGKYLQAATYLIGVYNSVAIFLGKKRYFRLDEDGEYVINNARVSECKHYDKYDLVIAKSATGDIDIDDKAYILIPAIPFSPQLMMFFGSTNYSYGTYHTIIRDNTYVADDFKVIETGEKMKYDFIESDDEAEGDRESTLEIKQAPIHIINMERDKVKEYKYAVKKNVNNKMSNRQVSRRNNPREAQKTVSSGERSIKVVNSTEVNKNSIVVNDQQIPVFRGKTNGRKPIDVSVGRILQAGVQTDMKTLKVCIPHKKGRINPQGGEHKSNVNDIVPVPANIVEKLEQIMDEKIAKRSEKEYVNMKLAKRSKASISKKKAT